MLMLGPKESELYPLIEKAANLLGQNYNPVKHLDEINRLMEFDLLSKYPDFMRTGINIEEEPMELQQMLFKEGYFALKSKERPIE